jgi:hypothetical protein
MEAPSTRIPRIAGMQDSLIACNPIVNGAIG